MKNRSLNQEIKDFYSSKKRRLGVHDAPFGEEEEEKLEDQFLAEEEIGLIKRAEKAMDDMLQKWVDSLVPPPVWAEPSGWDTIDANWRHSVMCTSIDRSRPAVSASGHVLCECRLIPLTVLSPGKEHMDDCVYVDDVKLGRERKDCVCFDMARGPYFLREKSAMDCK